MVDKKELKKLWDQVSKIQLPDGVSGITVKWQGDERGHFSVVREICMDPDSFKEMFDMYTVEESPKEGYFVLSREINHTEFVSLMKEVED